MSVPALPLRLLDPTSKPGGLPAPTPRPDDTRTGGDGAPITCRKCGHLITTAAARREVAGQHVHTRLNPHAFVFLFGCFSQAPGCVVHGTPTDEATWFAGCRWQYAHCARCLEHLGWCFSGAEDFCGLVLEKLVQPE